MNTIQFCILEVVDVDLHLTQEPDETVGEDNDDDDDNDNDNGDNGNGTGGCYNIGNPTDNSSNTSRGIGSLLLHFDSMSMGIGYYLHSSPFDTQQISSSRSFFGNEHPYIDLSSGYGYVPEDGEKKNDSQTTKSASVQSYTSTSTDREVKRSGSEFNSQSVSDMSEESHVRSTFPNMSQMPNNLRMFTFSELKSATKNFGRSVMVGEGGFGCVYKATLKTWQIFTDRATTTGGMIRMLVNTWYPLPVSRRRDEEGHKEWVTEVNVLGVVEHQNLVKLVGHCAEDDERGIQRLLIYEYMPNRSVEDHLSAKSSTPLPWDMRLRIAQDSARGLAYLHEEMDFQIIFRDFKSSNILLDEQWNAKLSDFGLARLGPSEGLSHVSTAVMGTIGYAAPEYVQTGRLTSKSDVWSYGVFLYELITGRRPLDRNRPKNEQKLLEWIRPYLTDTKRFRIILDPRLEGRYTIKTAQKLANVANRCLVRQPKQRPKMSEVLEMVNKIVEGTETAEKPQLPLTSLDWEKSSTEAKSYEFKLERMNVEPRNEESSWFFWRNWAPKVVRTCS
ncbi:hypothetical protein GIB67_027566 [Kingdonia uniflora]|uniref:Protein kinase domain-containing protein n=1 Tax=Kingdonia uniflora TaxID=39325 RepID=A0A7J7NLH3_9MAGN|nr:hypothetical protein GIB67_027566 [Kingdonia uniflora]